MENKGIALVIMAAGLGSRFKGLKQIQKVDKDGHVRHLRERNSLP